MPKAKSKPKSKRRLPSVDLEEHRRALEDLDARARETDRRIAQSLKALKDQLKRLRELAER